MHLRFYSNIEDYCIYKDAIYEDYYVIKERKLLFEGESEEECIEYIEGLGESNEV